MSKIALAPDHVERLLWRDGFEPVQCDECESVIGYGSGDLNCTKWMCPTCSRIKAAAMVAVIAERQRCAGVADSYEHMGSPSWQRITCRDIAAKIMAGEQAAAPVNAPEEFRAVDNLGQ